MTLTNEQRLLVTTALYHRAETFAGLGARPYGRKAYRDGLKAQAQAYHRLAEAFSDHTVITLTKKD